MDGVRYFLLNKEQDYRRHGRRLCSGCLDSGHRQTEWSRVCVRSAVEGQHIHVRVYISGQDWLYRDGKRSRICGIAGEDISEEEEDRLYAPYLVRELEDEADVLIDGVSGRYVWVVLEEEESRERGKERAEEECRVPEIQIFFETPSWISYLPEIYEGCGEDTFLHRFLSIFQWMYYDMGREISEIPHTLYPAFANRQTLEWLASWFGLENCGVWRREQLVWLVEHADSLAAIRGTRRYMEEMIRLYTGYMPFIVEYHETERYRTDLAKAKQLGRLYGEHSARITVILPYGSVKSKQEAAVLKQTIRSAAPACTECRMVLLEPYLFLDRYTYAGINSYLGGGREVSLNGEGLVPYVSIIGKRPEGRGDA